jgi:hypothetical protein
MKKIILIAMLVGVAAVFAGPQKNPARGPIVVQASVVAMEEADTAEIVALVSFTNAINSANNVSQIKDALKTWAAAELSAKKAKKDAEDKPKGKAK